MEYLDIILPVLFDFKSFILSLWAMLKYILIVLLNFFAISLQGYLVINTFSLKLLSRGF